MITIPFKDFPEFTETVTIDDTVYVLNFRWNTRGEYWTMKVSLTNGTVILTGVKLVPDYELIRKFIDLDIPGGLLFVVNLSGLLYTVTRDNLPSGSVSLIYLTEAERAAL